MEFPISGPDGDGPGKGGALDHGPPSPRLTPKGLCFASTKYHTRRHTRRDPVRHSVLLGPHYRPDSNRDPDPPRTNFGAWDLGLADSSVEPRIVDTLDTESKK